jgi:hypothetical protein
MYAIWKAGNPLEKIHVVFVAKCASQKLGGISTFNRDGREGVNNSALL